MLYVICREYNLILVLTLSCKNVLLASGVIYDLCGLCWWVTNRVGVCLAHCSIFVKQNNAHDVISNLNVPIQ